MFADIHHFSVLAQGGSLTGIGSTVTGTTVGTDASVSIYFGTSSARGCMAAYSVLSPGTIQVD
jgi:hypothetical protein